MKPPKVMDNDLTSLRANTEVIWGFQRNANSGQLGILRLDSYSWVRINYMRFQVTAIDPSNFPIVTSASPGAGSGLIVQAPVTTPLGISTDCNFILGLGSAYLSNEPNLPVMMVGLPSLWLFNPPSIQWGFSTLIGGENIGGVSYSLQVVRK